MICALVQASLHAILVRRGGTERFDVKILDVGAVIGEAPGDAVVVADDDHGRAGQCKAFDVPAGCGEMNFVPDRGNSKFEMSVVGQQRLAGGGVRATYNPIVAAEALANFVV